MAHPIKAERLIWAAEIKDKGFIIYSVKTQEDVTKYRNMTKSWSVRSGLKVSQRLDWPARTFTVTYLGPCDPAKGKRVRVKKQCECGRPAVKEYAGEWACLDCVKILKMHEKDFRRKKRATRKGPARDLGVGKYADWFNSYACC